MKSNRIDEWKIDGNVLNIFSRIQNTTREKDAICVQMLFSLVSLIRLVYLLFIAHVRCNYEIWLLVLFSCAGSLFVALSVAIKTFKHEDVVLFHLRLKVDCSRWVMPIRWCIVLYFDVIHAAT